MDTWWILSLSKSNCRVFYYIIYFYEAGDLYFDSINPLAAVQQLHFPPTCSYQYPYVKITPGFLNNGLKTTVKVVSILMGLSTFPLLISTINYGGYFIEVLPIVFNVV